MKILVLNPPSRVAKNVVRDVLYGCWCKGKRIGGGTVPALALLSVASVLRQSGFKVAFLDAAIRREPTERIVSLSASFDVIITSTSTMSIDEDADFLNGLKSIKESLITIVFGSHPTFMPGATIKRKGIDIIVRREPEYIIRDLLCAIRKKDGSWKKVNGIGFAENGRIVINPDYPFIEDLDDLPFLDVSLLPKDADYFNPLVKRLPYITTTVSRGCFGRCTFCTVPHFYGAKVRSCSANRVLDEVRHYRDKGYKEVYFRDETFTADKERNIKVCEGLIKNKLDLTWICNARVGTVDKETMVLMKKAGCHLIKFGVESGVQQILDRIKKGISLEQTADAFKWAKEAGLKTHAHVMLGLPGETEETLNSTINFIRKIRPTTASFGICTPYPGSRLFEEVAKGCPEIKDGSGSHLGILHIQALFNENFTHIKRDKLEKDLRRAYRSFYLRPAYLCQWLKRIGDPDYFKRALLAGTRIIDFSIRGE